MDEGSDRSPWLKRLFGLIGPSSPKKASDLERGIQDLEERGLLGTQEGEMIESLLEFGDILAREIMVPRTEVHAVAVDAPIQAILDLVKTHGHSRLPVHDGDIDRIMGILHVKDLLVYWGQDKVALEAILRPAMFVPETKKITDLLAEMRTQQRHMAVVIDEYGGTAGIVTIEDIIEEIVGEIQDEHDSEEPLLVPVSEDEVLCDGRLDVEEIADFFGVNIPKDGFDTIGGFIVARTGQVPKPGERITFDGLELVVEEADERHIIKVRVSRARAA